jgi:preprotein translocase subunit SecG
MQIFWNLVLALQIVAAIVMIGLVLVQQGKGADMGASFGSGASGSLFGATGSANFLSRSTSFCAAVFFACTLGLAYFGSSGLQQRPEGTSVFERAGAAGAASAPAAASAPPVAQIPTAPAAAAASAPTTAVAASASTAAQAPAPAQAAASAPQKP